MGSTQIFCVENLRKIKADWRKTPSV